MQANCDMSTAIADAKQEASRRFLRRIVVEDFGENQSKAAKGLGISQSQISDVLSGRRGLGYSALEILASYKGVSAPEARAKQAFLLVVEPGDRDDALAYLREAEGVAQRLHGATGDELLDHHRSGFRIWKRKKASPEANAVKLRDPRAVTAPPGKGPRRL